jgi:hypothetical protein
MLMFVASINSYKKKTAKRVPLVFKKKNSIESNYETEDTKSHLFRKNENRRHYFAWNLFRKSRTYRFK